MELQPEMSHPHADWGCTVMNGNQVQSYFFHAKKNKARASCSTSKGINGMYSVFVMSRGDLKKKKQNASSWCSKILHPSFSAIRRKFCIFDQLVHNGSKIMPTRFNSASSDFFSFWQERSLWKVFFVGFFLPEEKDLKQYFYNTGSSVCVCVFLHYYLSSELSMSTFATSKSQQWDLYTFRLCAFSPLSCEFQK